MKIDTLDSKTIEKADKTFEMSPRFEYILDNSQALKKHEIFVKTYRMKDSTATKSSLSKIVINVVDGCDCDKLTFVAPTFDPVTKDN